MAFMFRVFLMVTMVTYTSAACVNDFINDCASNPCRHGATCEDGKHQYTCRCARGYQGVNCEISGGSGCSTKPCRHGGVCTPSDGGYTCACIHGYEGQNCETDRDDCKSAPCRNNATCIDGIDDYSCSCVTGFTGSDCEIILEPCMSTPCQHGGQCNSTDDGYICDCRAGFTGNKCEKDVDDCLSSPCLNGGLCADGPGYFTCWCVGGYRGAICQHGPPTSCADVKRRDEKSSSGEYDVYPDGGNTSVKIYCEMDLDGGGWTVFQRHEETVWDAFIKNWAEYKAGFGEQDGDFWLGNDRLHVLTSGSPQSLRVELRGGTQGENRHATYRSFLVDDEDALYRLHVSGYGGDAGDSLAGHDGMAFSTIDEDNDGMSISCAFFFRGGWWYDNKDCYTADLNGVYTVDGLVWDKLGLDERPVSFKNVSMMMRPRDY